MKEKDIYQKMVSKFSDKKIMLQRVEMDYLPDLFYRSTHKGGWIEFKKLNKYPTKNIIEVPWRVGQLNWIRRYRQLNGNIFLFFYIENALWIFKYFNIQEKYTEAEMITLSCYKNLWKDIDWDKVYTILNKS